MKRLLSRSFFLLAFLCVPLACKPSTPKAPKAEQRDVTKERKQATLEDGRALTAMLYEGKTDKIFERFSDKMKQAVPLAMLEKLPEQMKSSLGTETEVLSEGVNLAGQLSIYWRKFATEKRETTLVMQWSLGPTGSIEGFIVVNAQEPAPSQYLDYQTKTPLRLPFDEEWYVVWGGRSIEQNYHAKAPDQRFALDLLIVRNGASFEGDGKENADYYAFGKPLVAPGSGIVIAASDGVEDNIPGVLNPAQALGNYVIIDHRNGEFSLLAHLQRGSVKVKAGDVVVPGAPLGLCGNSGNSSEAHLHYHLQNTKEPFVSEGLPIFFSEVQIDGTRQKKREVEQGQQIRHPK
jgi:murein DD-endopeptidase MepM/ murein hydrolase activator NlpD